jgi:diacylglycerol kinase
MWRRHLKQLAQLGSVKWRKAGVLLGSVVVSVELLRSALEKVNLVGKSTHQHSHKLHL